MMEPQDFNRPKPSERIWEPCVNGTGEDIPPCSVVMVTCWQDGLYVIAKVDRDDAVGGDIAFVGRGGVPAGLTGIITFNFPAWARFAKTDADSGSASAMDSSSGDTAKPVCGEFWGTEQGSYDLHRHHTGFKIISDPLIPDSAPMDRLRQPIPVETDTDFMLVVPILFGDYIDVGVVVDVCMFPVLPEADSGSGTGVGIG